MSITAARVFRTAGGWQPFARAGRCQLRGTELAPGMMVNLNHAVCELRECRCAGHFIPEAEASGTDLAVISSGEQVAARTEVRGDDAVHLDEPLGVLTRFEPAHSPLAFTSGLM